MVIHIMRLNGSILRLNGSRRLTMHLQNGVIQSHYMDQHGSRTSRASIVDNATIIKKINDFNRLTICEAMLIKLHEPLMNRQDTGFTKSLTLFS